jgi:hypothetical protein
LRCKATALPYGNLRDIREEGGKVLSAAQHKCYRSAVGRLMWLAPVRVDLMYIIKELARAVVSPTELDWQRLKKVLRYCQGTRDSVLKLELSDRAFTTIEVITDASWASGPRCQSTSGGVIEVGGFQLAAWSRTAPTVSQSSAESELLAINLGAGEGQVVQAIMAFVGYDLPIIISTDARAAMGILQRRGLGRCKHLNIKQLWLQEAVENGSIKIKKIGTDVNPADVFTKPVASARLRAMCERLHMDRGEMPQQQRAGATEVDTDEVWMIASLEDVRGEGEQAETWQQLLNVILLSAVVGVGWMSLQLWKLGRRLWAWWRRPYKSNVNWRAIQKGVAAMATRRDDR